MTAWWDPSFEEKSCKGLKAEKSGNSPVPAHMGAWPEREVPAGKSHFGAFLGGKREGLVLPVFVCERESLKEWEEQRHVA